MSAVAVAGPHSPARTSIRSCSAAPSAPPPGAIFDRALAASWEASTGRQRRACSAMRRSAHRQASDAACSAAIAAREAGENRVRARQDPNTSTRLGNTRYTETPVTVTQNTVRARQATGDHLSKSLAPDHESTATHDRPQHRSAPHPGELDEPRAGRYQSVALRIAAATMSLLIR